MGRKNLIFLGIAVALSVVMAVALGATFDSWLAGFVSIVTLFGVVKGGQVVVKKVKKK